jgi:hypothetical protein
MRRLPGVSLGTYFAKGAAGGIASRDTSPMRGLVYLVKNNRPDPVPPQLINHPRHSTGKPVLVSIESAPAYVADIVLGNLAKIRRSLKLPDQRLVIVPVPSSSVTKATLHGDRWPALQIARALERGGAGKACPAIVNLRPIPPKTRGHASTVEELVAAMTCIHELPPGPILLVDDVITDGDHAAAMDTLLGRPKRAGILVVGLTDSNPVDSCYRPRWFTLVYDETQAPLRPYIERRAPVA